MFRWNSESVKTFQFGAEMVWNKIDKWQLWFWAGVYVSFNHSKIKVYVSFNCHE